MAKQTINIGTADNDGTGDSIRHSFDITNQNFTELYNLINGGDGVHFLKLVDTPKALVATSPASPVVLIASDNASTVTQSAIVGGYGIEVLTQNLGTANSTITLSVSTATNLYDFTLISDLNPTLGGDLLGGGFRTSGFAAPFAPDSLATKQYVDDSIPTAISMAGTLEDIAIGTDTPSTPRWKQGSSINLLNTYVARDNRGDIYVGDVYSTVLHGQTARINGGLFGEGGLYVRTFANTDVFTVDIGTAAVHASGDVTVAGSITASGITVTNGLSLTTPSITKSGTSGTGDIGQSGNRFGTIYGTTFDGIATAARYADLAENYKADANYEPGTVLVFGGKEEVTASTFFMDKRVAGVVSTNPAHLMNSMQEGGTPVALVGRVPCKVVGVIKKGDLLVTSAIKGVATVSDDPKMGTVIGKALENYEGTDIKNIGTIEVVVGRV